eukprot:14211719-Alexandrium_andersonii.AAC.1
MGTRGVAGSVHEGRCEGAARELDAARDGRGGVETSEERGPGFHPAGGRVGAPSVRPPTCSYLDAHSFNLE